MKKYLLILPVLVALILVLFLVLPKRSSQEEQTFTPENEEVSQESAQEEGREGEVASLTNPASAYCVEQGGELEIITDSDGSQFGMCDLGDYSCEEWTYFNGECTVGEDA